MTERLPEIGIQVAAGNWPKELDLQRLSQSAIRAACGFVEHELPEDAEVSIVFADDAMLAELNETYRGKAGPTNVLSFATNDGLDPADWSPLLGDIVLSHETIAREAQSMEFDHHLTHMVVHGFLHLLGYDHRDDGEASLMEGLETRILASLDIADPYSTP